MSAQHQLGKDACH